MTTLIVQFLLMFFVLRIKFTLGSYDLEVNTDYDKYKLIHEGKELQLTCKNTVNPLEAVTWAPPSNVPREAYYLHIKDGNIYTITFKNTKREYAGKYKCKSYNSYGDSISKDVHVVEPLEVNTDYSDYKVLHEGKDLELTCKSQFVPSQSILWKFPKRVPRVSFNNFKAFSAYIEDGKYTLSIKNAKREHSGKYTCVLYTGDGDPFTKDVHVGVSPKINKIFVNGNESVANEVFNISTEKATLKCTDDESTYPKSVYTWEKNNIKLENEDSNEITVNEDGVYKCKLSNLIGSDESNVTIRHLHREVPGPVPKAVFTLNITGQYLYTLTFEDSKRVFAGKYVCNCYTENGRQKFTDLIDVTVTEKLDKLERQLESLNVHIIYADYKIYENQELELTCKNIFNLIEAVHWTLPRYVPYDAYTLDIKDENVFTLNFKKTKREYAGRYTCKSHTMYGDELIKVLHVGVTPKIAKFLIDGIETKNGEESLVHKKDVTLECIDDTFTYPKSVFLWKRNSETLQDKESNKITIKEGGEYSCTLSNSIGSSNEWIVPVTFIDKTNCLEVSRDIKGENIKVLHEGQALELICKNHCDPTQSVTWTPPSYVTSDKYTVYRKDSKYTLNFKNAKREFIGKYTCTSHTRNGEELTKNIDVIAGNILDPNCIDSFYNEWGTCSIIVEEKRCKYPHLARVCCKSCAESGQLQLV